MAASPAKTERAHKIGVVRNADLRVEKYVKSHDYQSCERERIAAGRDLALQRGLLQRPKPNQIYITKRKSTGHGEN